MTSGVTTLATAQKTRAKIQTKRRLPTRNSLRKTGSQDATQEEDAPAASTVTVKAPAPQVVKASEPVKSAPAKAAAAKVKINMNIIIY